MPRVTRLSQVNPSQSQRSQPNYNEETFSSQDKATLIKEASNKLVTFVLHHLDNSKLLRRTAMQKVVALKGVNWTQQLDAANITLKNIYGCELEICDDPSVKIPSYYVKKLTPHIQFPVDHKDCPIEKIITFLIMTILYMSNGKCSEKAMFEHLTKLKAINVDEGADENSVRDILKDLAASRMVLIENEEILWGCLADSVISKLEILKFVSKVYNTNVDSWGELHTQALQQIEEKVVGEEEDVEQDANEEEAHSSQLSIKSKSQHSQRSRR